MPTLRRTGSQHYFSRGNRPGGGAAQMAVESMLLPEHAPRHLESSCIGRTYVMLLTRDQSLLTACQKCPSQRLSIKTQTELRDGSCEQYQRRSTWILSRNVLQFAKGFRLGHHNTKTNHTEDMIWTSLCMELISKMPRRSLRLLCVAAITLLI